MQSTLKRSAFVILICALQPYPALAQSDTLYLRCVQIEEHTDGKTSTPAPTGTAKIFRIHGQRIDDWIALRRIFVNNCERLSYQCKTEVNDSFIRHELVAPRLNSIKKVFYIERYTGAYSGWTQFPGDESPYSTFKGTCSKIDSPELETRKF